MQKQTSLYIPQPCHEDWNNMTPVQQGKFCASCSKEVVDFTLMSDRQILNFLSKQSGKLCGRFDAEQLQRPLQEIKIEKKKSWWMALTMPLLFLFERSEAQEDVRIIGDTIYNVTPSRDIITEQLIGKVSICESIKQIMVTGKVADENGYPLSYVTIMQKGTSKGITTDSNGNFSMNIGSYENSATLTASYVGYETIEKEIDVNNPNVLFTLKFKPIHLSDVIVTTNLGTSCTRIRLGGLSVGYKVTTFEKIDTAVKKIFNVSAFKIYPNPAIKGNDLHLEIKQAGEYQLQLLDNESRLVKAEEINTASAKSTVSIQLPSNIAAGIYYLRLIDERRKKQYTEKLIIQ